MWLSGEVGGLMKIINIAWITTAPPAIWRDLKIQVQTFTDLGFEESELCVVIDYERHPQPYVTIMS